MKKFEFSLKKMLSYKEQMQEFEKNKLARLTQKKNKLEDLIEALELQSSKLSNERLQAAKVGMTVMQIRNYTFQLENNRKYIKQLSFELQNANIEVDKQLKAVLAITQDVEGLNKLKEKQYKEYIYEDTKAQENAVLEFVSSKLVRDNSNI